MRPYRRRTGPPLDADVLAALHMHSAPMSSNDLGLAVGVYNGRSWKFPGYQTMLDALGRLRDDGAVVKLPHEGSRTGSTYALCDGHEEASRMQLAACEAALLDLSAEDAAGQKGRMLRQALDGLRATMRTA